jgi:hypothetical protein
MRPAGAEVLRAKGALRMTERAEALTIIPALHYAQFLIISNSTSAEAQWLILFLALFAFSY